MSKRFDPISYYDSHAVAFASQATDKEANRFEYEKNMPSLLALSDDIAGNVLDFGCGAGNFTAMLVRDDRIVEGCDTSPRLLSIAASHYPHIQFHVSPPPVVSIAKISTI